MNDEDLERELRSQHGPREGGYAPAPLPVTLDGASVTVARPSRLPRAGLVVGAALAGALAVAVIAGIFSASDSGVGGTDSASPSASASTQAEGSCAPMDVAFSAEPWGGAAGSRGTTVTIALAGGRYACSFPRGVTAQIADANGTVLLTASAPPAAGSVTLEPGGAFALSVVWSNWCAADVAAPVTLSLTPDGWASPVPVAAPAGGPDIPPPCSGAGSPSTLYVTKLAPQRY